MNRRFRTLLPAALIAPLLLAACGTETTELPPGLGPVALATDVAMPSDCEAATGTGSLAIGAARAVLANPSYSERKARGCVPFSLAEVWQVLQIPTGVDLGFWPERTESDCEAWLDLRSAVPGELRHQGDPPRRHPEPLHLRGDLARRREPGNERRTHRGEGALRQDRRDHRGAEDPRLDGLLRRPGPSGLDAHRHGPPAQHERALRRPGEAPELAAGLLRRAQGPASPVRP